MADPQMSPAHAVLTRALGRWSVVDAGSKNGAFVNGARVERAILEDGDVVETGRSFFVFRDRDGESLGELGACEVPGVVTMSPVLGERCAQLARIAAMPVAVVLGGESGTGKELAARAVHAMSGRVGRLVAVNYTALVDALAVGELFGHRRGAFTGATEERTGLVRAADGGTLFLDEVADLPMPVQGRCFACSRSARSSRPSRDQDAHERCPQLGRVAREAAQRRGRPGRVDARR